MGLLVVCSTFENVLGRKIRSVLNAISSLMANFGLIFLFRGTLFWAFPHFNSRDKEIFLF